jgi:hypothetical protein
MVMNHYLTEKGGASMVHLTLCWISRGFDATAPACPREEFVRRP